MSETNVERRSEDQRLKRTIFLGVGSHCLLPPVDAIAATVVPASSPSASRRGFGITLRSSLIVTCMTNCSLARFASSNGHSYTLDGNCASLKLQTDTRRPSPSNLAKYPGESVITHLSGKIVVYFRGWKKYTETRSDRKPKSEAFALTFLHSILTSRSPDSYERKEPSSRSPASVILCIDERMCRTHWRSRGGAPWINSDRCERPDGHSAL